MADVLEEVGVRPECAEDVLANGVVFALGDGGDSGFLCGQVADAGAGEEGEVP